MPRTLTVHLPAELPEHRVAELAHAVHAVLIAAGLGGKTAIHTGSAPTSPGCPSRQE